MSWKLWLDDERPLPEDADDTWKVARSSEEAKILLKQLGPENLEQISFDHDLGNDDTAIVFIRWMIANCFDCSPEYRVHSQNPVGRKNIESLMESWKKAKTK